MNGAMGEFGHLERRVQHEISWDFMSAVPLREKLMDNLYSVDSYLATSTSAQLS